MKPSLEGWKHVLDAALYVLPIDLETFLRGMLINLLIYCSKLVYNVCIFGCVRFCVRYYSKGRGLTAPFFYGLHTLHGLCPSSDGLLSGIVIDRFKGHS